MLKGLGAMYSQLVTMAELGPQGRQSHRSEVAQVCGSSTPAFSEPMGVLGRSQRELEMYKHVNRKTLAGLSAILHILWYSAICCMYLMRV